MKPVNFSTGKKVPTLHKMHGMFSSQPGPNKFGDVADLPGTGPAGQLCKQCNFIRHNKNATQWGRCEKAAIARRVSVGTLSMISLLTQSCRKFEERKPDDKPWMHRDDFKMTEEKSDQSEMF